MKYTYWSILALGCSIIVSIGIIKHESWKITYVQEMRVETANVDYAKFLLSRYALIDKSTGVQINGSDNTLRDSSLTFNPFDSKIMMIHDYTGEEELEKGGK